MQSQIREDNDFLTLRQRISISFEEIVNKKKKYQKSQNLTKHGVKNLVAMATSYTLDKIFFTESCSPINFSESGKFS